MNTPLAPIHMLRSERPAAGRFKRLAVALATLYALAASSAARADQWLSAGQLKLPPYHYSYLAATPAGDLLATTFNVDQIGGAARPMPALLVKNPLAPKPEVVELCRIVFDAQRGYGGIACDAAGNFYLSGDTGVRDTCFLRKFKPDGTPDPTFGDAGEVKPRRRCLGVDVLGDYLFLAIDWGEVAILDARTGRYLGSVPPAQGENYLRDIAVDPTSMRIYGVAAGNVMVWERGAPWDPSSYRYRHLAAEKGRVRAGEGISFDPLDRAALITPVPGNTLARVWPDGRTSKSTLTSASPQAPLADSVLSFDGTTLFVSDFNLRAIHVMRRSGSTDAGPTLTAATAPSVSPAASARPAASPAAVSPSTTPLAAPPPAAASSPVQWHRSYLEVVETARRRQQPMVVYFRRQGTPKCDEFERSVLLSPEFNRRGRNLTCVFEDTAFNTLLAYRFGVFRVPQLVVLDSQGEVANRFVFNIDTIQMFSALDAVR